MKIRNCIALLIAMHVTLLCFSQARVQSRDVKRISGKAYLISKGHQFEIRESVVLAKLKEGKKQLKDGIKLIKSHSFGMLEIAVPDSIAIEEYVNILDKTGDFEYVEYDTFLQPCMSANDPHLLNNDQWGIYHINAHYAWNITTGSPSVKVAVIDIDGFEYHHPDIDYGNDSYSNISISEGIDYVSPNDSTPSDYHGTMVAGVIGAKTNNGVGIAGIAGGNNSEGSKIIPYNTSSACNAVCAIYDAISKGAKVINMSFSCDETTAFNQAITSAYNNGITMVCPTGKGGLSSILYPASHDLTIAVGSTDEYDHWASNSNYGTGLDLVAPGFHIISTATAYDGYYLEASGTSLAAPYVSGVVALMLSVNINLTPNEIRTILNNTAKKIDPYTYTSGWNEKVGYGLLNACAAVLVAMNHTISGPSTICCDSIYTYTINEPIAGSAVWEWSIDNNDFYCGLNGNQCPVSYTGVQQYNVANLTASLKWNGKILKTLTKRIVMHGTDLVVYGEQDSYVSSNGTFPYRQFTIPASNGLRMIPDSLNREVFDGKESLPIKFTEDNTRDFIFDFCGYGITDINGGNMVYLSSSRFDGMDISFSGTNSPTYFYHNGSYVSFEMPYTSPNYPVTLQAHSDSLCHDFCLTFNVVPLPGVLYGDDIIWVNIDGSMLYITFMYGGEPIGNGQFYFPNYTVTISKIPGGTCVYSNTFPGTQTSFSVNTSTWTSGIYSISIVCNGNIYSKSICL